MRPTWYSLAGTLVLIGAALAGRERMARALPQAGTDVLPVVASVEAVSLLGEESFALTGRATVSRAPPRLERGVEVVDIEIVALELVGAGRVGLVSLAERLNDGPDYVSAGELRSLQAGQGFPASSFVGLFVDVSLPASPIGALELHNEQPLHLTPREAGREATLVGWPPFGVSYGMEPIFGVDNDGDGDIDEDTADDDGDGFVDEDRPGPDPDSARTGAGCGDDADCDGSDGEDPPIELCASDICDNDGDGRIDEDPACIPLLDPSDSHRKAGFCIRRLSLEIAPELPSYSVARDGPSALHPADVLSLTPHPSSPAAGGNRQAPFVSIPCQSLGLSADGCDNGSDGDRDDLDALSYGGDLTATGGPEVSFSVGPGAAGVAGSAVETQGNCPPTQPGLSPEPESDVFGSRLDGANYLVMDGNGPVGACAPAFPLGLLEGATVRDDLDALYGLDGSTVDGDGDGVPESAVYLSLDAASPSLAAFGLSAADILTTADGRPPAVYASAEALGLRAGDDLDALCLRESGNGAYGTGDALYFSLAPGSPTLARIGAGPGDILVPGEPPAVARQARSLGLRADDDMNALECRTPLGPVGVTGDANCDGATNSIDAALVLQREAGLVGSLPCARSADANGDGVADGADAAFILRFDAGLVELPPTPP